MADFLFQSWQDVQLAYERALTWLLELQFNPGQWDAVTWALVIGAVLLLSVLLVRGRRRRRAAKGPQFLLTNGQIALLDDLPRAATPDGGRRRPALLQAPADASYQLRVTVNNLNHYPVQLLEIAVRTSAGKIPVVADASAVVPPNGAVDVVADIADLPGERGSLELYLYNTTAAPRSLRLQVPIEWEPWNQRYRVKATAQRLEPSRVVASEARQRQERAAFRRGRLKGWVAGAAQGLNERAGEVRRDLAVRRERAASERRERRAAEREAAERRSGQRSDGPFSVPLAPSGARAAETWRDEPKAAAEAWAQGELDPGDDLVDAEASDEAGPSHDSRPADDLDVADREPEPRRRLEFPDDF